MRSGDRNWFRDAALIDGRWVTAATQSSVVNPATGAAIGSAARSDAAAVDAAVAAATGAREPWAATQPARRAALLEALHRELLARRDELVAATVAEVGAPVRVAREAHVDAALDVIDSYARLAAGFPFEERTARSRVVHEPAGVVAAIVPWNYPLYQLAAKVAPALAAGCPVVVKPAELTPLTAYLLADAALDAGVPPGVLGLVPGSGSVVGEALVAHRDVDVVSFTGSTAVGRRVAARAAGELKRVCLELGGKSASVVLRGADLQAAVAATVGDVTVNSGQTCTAWTRLLVPEEALDAAVEQATARAEALVVGDPRDEGTDLGPLVSAAQRDVVSGFLERARAAGARVAGGGAEPPAGLPDGHYVRPAVVWGVRPDDEIAQEEVFGPVLTVLGYRDEDEAVAIANGTRYGLSGAVWARDDRSAVAVARRLRTGQVAINGAPFDVEAPFGGVKQSGIGRELGVHGLAELCEPKAIREPARPASSVPPPDVGEPKAAFAR